ncbi:hypothetical protein [Streptomyces scabiei]|nr:hypothetical protein [Streptomyces scabiei]
MQPASIGFERAGARALVRWLWLWLWLWLWRVRLGRVAQGVPRAAAPV